MRYVALLVALLLAAACGACAVRNLHPKHGKAVDRFFDRQARRGPIQPIPATGEEAEIALKNHRLSSTKSSTKSKSSSGGWIKLSR
jgi:hypothetical protein